MTTGAYITGDKALDKALAEFPRKLRNKGVRKATRESAKFVLSDARRYAPHDEGLLEKSLVVRSAKGRGGRRFRTGTFGHAVSTREGLFKGEEFYGGFVELGTKPRQTKSGKNRGQMDPTPFMREALYTNEKKVKQIFINTLRSVIPQIAAESRK